MAKPERLPSGKYRLRTYAHGRSWREVVDAPNEARAQELQDAFERRVRGTEDTAIDGLSASMGDLLDRLLKRKRSTWEPNTYDAFESYVRLHLKPRLGDVKVGAISTSKIDAVVVGLSDDLAPASVEKCWQLLTQGFRLARTLHWREDDPMPEEKPYRVRKKKIEPPKDEDYAKLLAAAGTPSFRACLALVDATGLRRGEVCALQWEHIDLERAQLRVEQAAIISREQGLIVKPYPKEDESFRQIAIGPDLLLVLKEHRVRAAATALRLGVPLAPTTFLFHNYETGMCWRPDSITTKFLRAKKKAGVRFRFHDLRHGHTTRLLAAGVDQRTVMGRLGWADLRMVSRYGHFVPAADHDAAELAQRPSAQPVDGASG